MAQVVARALEAGLPAMGRDVSLTARGHGACFDGFPIPRGTLDKEGSAQVRPGVVSFLHAALG